MKPEIELAELEELQKITTKTQAAHYVDNKKFLAALLEYREAIDNAKAEGNDTPRVPNYIGECFIKIATHLSYKSNFINYTFRDDMISDGIENCLTAATKFDPSKSSNPFAYYTQIIYFAFIRRIQKEKKHQATKYKLIENLDFESIIQNAEDSEAGMAVVEYLKRQLDSVDIEKRMTPAENKAAKKKKAKKEETSIDFLEQTLYNKE
jgi:DNA-directed RNA polymerase specialized sigma24 family protein